MATRAKKKNAVAKVDDQQALATLDYGDDAGAGFEGTTKDDYSIPFLTILEKTSPACDEASGDYNEDAKPGNFVNSVTDDLYDGKEEGVRFIPVQREHSYVEWRPDRGGFVQAHFKNAQGEWPKVVQTARQECEFNELQTPDGNDLTETFTIYGLVLGDDSTFEQVVMSFTGTRIRTYKALMTKANAIKTTTPDGRIQMVPLFAHVYRLKTASQTNEHGSWWVPKFSFDGKKAIDCRMKPGDARYQMALAFRELVNEGVATADRDSTIKGEAAPAEDDDVAF